MLLVYSVILSKDIFVNVCTLTDYLFCYFQYYNSEMTDVKIFVNVMEADNAFNTIG